MELERGWRSEKEVFLEWRHSRWRIRNNYIQCLDGKVKDMYGYRKVYGNNQAPEGKSKKALAAGGKRYEGG